MLDERIVALVGRPNVGKSRLFNRLAGKRISIVHDQPGVTRDVVTTEIDDDFTLMDTGGLGMTEAMGSGGIARAVEDQVDLAIVAAGLILFVVDGKEGPTPLDEDLAARLRRAGKPLILVVNKIDNPEQEEAAGEFSRFGFREAISVSAEHGRGEDELRQAIAERLGPRPEEKAEGGSRIKICFVGRPNVGKSSLGNRLLQSDRLIVTDIPGTTRDAVELNLDYQTPGGEVWPFRMIDTAGIRKRTKVSSPVEYFSATRSEHAVESADVVFLLIDAMEGVTNQEQQLAGMVLEKGKALVLVVNKWDLAQQTFREGGIEGYENEREFREAFSAAVRKELFFTPDSPVIFVSAKEGFALDRLMKAARRLDWVMERKLSTSKVNRLMADLAEKKSPPAMKGRRFRVYYAVQTGTRPFTIRLFCNEAARLQDSYRRYLESGIIKAFDLQGCPIRFELVGKPKRERRK